MYIFKLTPHAQYLGLKWIFFPVSTDNFSSFRQKEMLKVIHQRMLSSEIQFVKYWKYIIEKLQVALIFVHYHQYKYKLYHLLFYLLFINILPVSEARNIFYISIIFKCDF